jgi:uncharacterized RDD family membrane protein YckC
MMQISFEKTKTREHVADFSSRVLAFLLDALLLMFIIGVIEFYTVSSNEQAWLFKGERLLHFLLGWLYFAGAESSSRQATIGKQLLDLRVADMQGERISFRCATLRYVIKPISIFVFIIRFLTGSPLTYSQLFHDKIAKTKVMLT